MVNEWLLGGCVLAAACVAVIGGRAVAQWRDSKSIQPAAAANPAQESGAWQLGWRYNLTPRELIFFRHLQRAFPECYMFPHQGLQYLLRPTVASGNAKLIDKVSRKYAGLFVDMVVCRDNMAPALAIQYLDHSHDPSQTDRGLARVEKACNSAGLKLIYVDLLGPPPPVGKLRRLAGLESPQQDEWANDPYARQGL